MGNLVSANSSSHWYHPTGGACHSVPMKTKPGETRATTLKDARTLNLYPSVTNILGILDKPMLSAWKQEQAILAALTLPRRDSETDDEFAKRVVEDASSQVRDAADKGVQIHAVVEEFLLTGKRMETNPCYHLCEPTISWLEVNVLNLHYAEKTVVGLGYAGKLDFKAEIKDLGLCIVDTKTRKRTNGKFAVYDENGLQLSAYLEADSITHQRANNRVSLLIDSVAPGPPHLHVWPNEDHEQSFNCFKNLFHVWTYIKNYNPINPS